MNLFKKKQNSKIDLKVDQDESSEAKTPVNTKKNVNVTRNIIITLKILLLIFLTFSLARVPYVGTFIDATFFSLPFGWTKYFAYLVLYLLIIFSWFPKYFHKIFNFKTVSISLIIWLLIAIIMSAIGVIINKNTGTGFNEQFIGQNGFITNWINDQWNKVESVNSWFYPGHGLYGGLIAFFFVIIFEMYSPAILITICGILLISFVSWVIHKQIKLLKSQNSLKNSNEPSKQFEYYTSLISKKHKYEHFNEFITDVSNKYNDIPINDLSNLTGISVDNYKILSDSLESLKSKLNNFFKIIQVSPKLLKTDIMFQSFTLVYEFESKKELKLLKSIDTKIKDTLYDLEINYYFKENNFYISEKIEDKSTIVIKDLIRDIGINSKFNLAIGKFSDRKSCYLNSLYFSNILLIGSKGSGRTMTLSNLLLSLAMLNNNKLINMNLIDFSENKFKSLHNLPQLKNTAFNIIDANNVIDNLLNITQQRLKLLSESKCQTFAEYNSKNKNKFILPIEVLAINNFEEFISFNQTEIVQKIKIIITNSYKTGIISLISFNEISELTYELKEFFNLIICLRLDSEEESNKILGITNAKYLWNNGDAIIKLNGEHYFHIQTPFVNKEETTSIVNLIASHNFE